MTINIWRLQFLNLSTIDMIIVFWEAKVQGQVSLIKSVHISPHANLMEVSNLANESWNDFLASVARFAIT